MSNMVRPVAVGVALAICLSGCFSGGAREKDGALDPAVLDRTVQEASFHVRVPERWRTSYKLLNVSRVTGPEGHYMVSFDLGAGTGPVLTVDEGGRALACRAYTDGARDLGSERVGAALWRVYDQSAAGGLVYVTKYPDGVEVVLVGGTDRGPLRSLARALGAPS